MKKYYSALVCGFGAGVLQVVPLAKSFSCCIIIPGAAILALVLDRRARNVAGNIPIEMRKALIMGLFTGLFAALFGSVFEVIITLATKTNDMVDSFPQFQRMITELPFSSEIKQEVIDLFKLMVDDIKDTGFSFLYTMSIIFNNVLLNSAFGILGGLIGAQIFNNQIKKNQDAQ